ncbi:hypothetical protein [Rhizobium sp. LC145]|nr:hypothetical protein [Rhizobium sp. LC145]
MNRKTVLRLLGGLLLSSILLVALLGGPVLMLIFLAERFAM